MKQRTSLVAQWLGLQASTAGVMDSDPWLSPCVAWPKKKKKKGKWNRIESHAVNPHAAAAAKSLQSCLTLCDPIDRSPPGSPVPGILQARTLEWVAISFSNT